MPLRLRLPICLTNSCIRTPNESENIRRPRAFSTAAYAVDADPPPVPARAQRRASPFAQRASLPESRSAVEVVDRLPAYMSRPSAGWANSGVSIEDLRELNQQLTGVPADAVKGPLLTTNLTNGCYPHSAARSTEVMSTYRHLLRQDDVPVHGNSADGVMHACSIEFERFPSDPEAVARKAALTMMQLALARGFVAEPIAGVLLLVLRRDLTECFKAAAIRGYTDRGLKFAVTYETMSMQSNTGTTHCAILLNHVGSQGALPKLVFQGSHVETNLNAFRQMPEIAREIRGRTATLNRVSQHFATNRLSEPELRLLSPNQPMRRVAVDFVDFARSTLNDGRLEGDHQAFPPTSFDGFHARAGQGLRRNGAVHNLLLKAVRWQPTRDIAENGLRFLLVMDAYDQDYPQLPRRPALHRAPAINHADQAAA